MKVPLSWLQSFVPVDLPVDELVDVMGANGLEVDGVTHPGAGTEGVLTAKVLEWALHPDADKLRVVQIHNGTEQIELVCGASNFDVGDIVVHAGPGASIPGMTMQAKELRGVVSHGMLCSAKELQAGEDGGGIMVLSPDVEPGTPITDLLPLGEPVIDVEVLADRGDHHSILGIARELAAILDLQLTIPDATGTDQTGPVELEITEPEACTQFATRTVGNVAVGTAPWPIRFRLAQCGVRSISNVVDVTNFVMLELGQPMHAYDLDTVAGNALGVRFAEAGERLTTLDDQERELDARDLLVVDGQRAVGLAGVMGGADTEVSAATTTVCFEAATWDPKTVRATSLRLGLHSEAGMRFARRVDPGGAVRACNRAYDLMTSMVDGITDLGANHAGSPEAGHDSVTVQPSWVRGFIGLDTLTDDRQAELLRRAGCEVVEGDDELVVTPPSWRGDLLRPADVAEEVVRLHGYDHVPATLPHTGVRGGLTAEQKAERLLVQTMLAHGLHEAVTRPFVGAQNLEGVLPGSDPVVLANPLAQDAASMRTSLVEGLLTAARRNVGQGRQGVALFEYGRIFRRAGGATDQSLAAFGERWRWTDPDGEVLPTQPRTLGLVAQGRKAGRGWLDKEATWSVFDLLAALDAVVAALGPADDPDFQLTRTPVGDRDGFHPGRSATLHLPGRDGAPVEVGFVGQLHPTEAGERDLPEPVVVAELLIEPLLDALGVGRPPRPGRELVRHPATTVDVALVADDAVAYDRLVEVVRDGAGDVLDGLWLFDEYRGEQVGEGKRSLAMRLRLQSPDRQLTDDDKAAVLTAIGEKAEAVGATLRS